MKKVNVLQKIKDLNWKIRLVICIFVTIINLIIFNYIYLNSTEYEKNYNYEQIYSLNAVVTDLYSRASLPIVRGGTAHIYDYLDIKLENGKEVTISIHNKDDYFKGQNITIYTNGKDYATTETGVVDSELTPTVSGIVSVLLIVCICMTWVILFEGKGIVICLLMLLIFLGTM